MNTPTAIALKLCLLVSLGITFGAATAPADILHVPADYPTIQAAINAAFAGDVVEIADGTYAGPGNNHVSFLGKPITVRSASGNPTTCIIDSTGGAGIFFLSDESADSTLSGVKITHGGIHLDGSNPTLTNCILGPGGEGIRCYSSNAIIVDCTLTGNHTTYGAIYCQNSSPTITNCIITDNVMNYGGGICCYSNSHPTITNCIITNNTASNGGGLACSHSSQPTLINCTIESNLATRCGGGLYSAHDSAPTLTNCIIAYNTAEQSGGGVCCELYAGASITDCTITYNSSTERGGGVCCLTGASPTISNTAIDHNCTTGHGGGLYCIDYSSPQFIACSINHNEASEHGGGVYCAEGGNPLFDECAISGNSATKNAGGVYARELCDPIVRRCTIQGNAALVYDGGGVYCWVSDALFTDCLISDNSAGRYAGAAFNRYLTNPTFDRCTLAHNTGQQGGGSLYTFQSSPLLTNCILWSVGSPEEIFGSGTPIITYSTIQGGWDGPGNIAADPLFVDPDGPDNNPNTWSNNNYRLSPASPCIDTGDPNTIPQPPALDLDEHLRLWNGDDDNLAIIDMGAYEFGSTLYGDTNCDGLITFDDVNPFVTAVQGQAAYELQYPHCNWLTADCDHNNNVNFDDITPFVDLLAAE